MGEALVRLKRARLGGRNSAMLWFTLRQLRAKNPETRRRAAFKLGASRKRTAVPALAAALGDPDWGVRHAAVEALGRIGDPRAGDALVAALRDKDWTVRSAAAAALMYVTDARSLDALVAALKAPDEFVRSSAVVALAKIGGRRAAQAVASMLRDDDPGVLEQTLKALAQLGWAPASPAERAWFVVAKKEWDQAVQLGGLAIQPLAVALDRSLKKGGGGWAAGVEAARALGNIGDARAVPALAKHLGVCEDSVAKIIALALGQIGDEGAVEPLVQALHRRNPEVRAMVMAALLTFNHKVVDPAIALLAEYKRQRPDVIDAVIALLSRVGDERAVEPLMLLVGVPRFGSVAAAAVKTIMDRLGIGMTAEQLERLQYAASPHPSLVSLSSGEAETDAAWQVA